MAKKKNQDESPLGLIDIVQKGIRVKKISSGKTYIVKDFNKKTGKICVQPVGFGETEWNRDICDYELAGQPHIAYRPAIVSTPTQPVPPAKMYASRFPKRNTAR